MPPKILMFAGSIRADSHNARDNLKEDRAATSLKQVLARLADAAQEMA